MKAQTEVYNALPDGPAKSILRAEIDRSAGHYELRRRWSPVWSAFRLVGIGYLLAVSAFAGALTVSHYWLDGKPGVDAKSLAQVGFIVLLALSVMGVCVCVTAIINAATATKDVKAADAAQLAKLEASHEASKQDLEVSGQAVPH